MAVVVGVDCSAESKDALRWAIAEARLRGTEVEAVHVWRHPISVLPTQPFVGDPVTTGPAVDPDELRRLAEQRLAGVVAEVAHDDDVRIVQTVVEGHPSAKRCR